MTTQPVRPVTIRTLRSYQEDMVSFLCEEVAAGRRDIALVSPTGSGKTVVLVEFFRRVLSSCKGAVVAAPSLTTEAGFAQEGEDLFFQAREDGGASKEDFRAHLTGARSGRCWLTTHQQLVRYGTGVLPEDLTDWILVLDEAHHAGTSKDEKKLDTQIGKFRAAWMARGGTVVATTATPFRTDGKDVLTPATRAYVRTTVMHALSGYAPARFQIRTVMLSRVTAHTTAEFMGETLSAEESKRGDSYLELFIQWVNDGRPKVVIIVPGDNSVEWGRRLERLRRGL